MGSATRWTRVARTSANGNGTSTTPPPGCRLDRRSVAVRLYRATDLTAMSLKRDGGLGMTFRSWAGTGRRVRSIGGALALAAALLLSGLLQAVPTVAADGVGELVVQPAVGKTIKDVNAKFGTSTHLQLTDT